MKRFRCFICGRWRMLKDMQEHVFGLTCTPCMNIMAELPPEAQKLFSFVFRRLEALEREIHGSAKVTAAARRRS